MSIGTKVGDVARRRISAGLALLRRASFMASSTLSHVAAFGVVGICAAAALSATKPTPPIRIVPVVPNFVVSKVPRRIPATAAPAAAATVAAPESKEKSPPGPTTATPEKVPADKVQPDKVQPEKLPAEPVWATADIEGAASICGALLQSSGMQYAMLEPIKHGQCGTPAPITLTSVDDTKVKLTPPVTINCPLAAALDIWVKQVLQPAAQDIFGARVVRLDDASSYVCRNRNGEATGPISEHAFANAFDVAAFVLADKRVIAVREWGATVQTTATRPGLKGALASAVASPARASVPPTKEIVFLKRIHDEACRTFGTVLGPEANEAHREHLHFDLKTRRGKAICQ